MAETVYLVMGSTGEYSDHRTWSVAAYLDRTLADRHADTAAVRAKYFYEERCEHDEKQMGAWCVDCGLFSEDVGRRFMGALDPAFKSDYTGTDYYVVEAPLLSAVPAVPAVPPENAADADPENGGQP